MGLILKKKNCGILYEHHFNKSTYPVILGSWTQAGLLMFTSKPKEKKGYTASNHLPTEGAFSKQRKTNLFGKRPQRLLFFFPFNVVWKADFMLVTVWPGNNGSSSPNGSYKKNKKQTRAEKRHIKAGSQQNREKSIDERETKGGVCPLSFSLVCPRWSLTCKYITATSTMHECSLTSKF